MSLMMEARKVQKVGYSTLIVSLPKDWVEEVGLKQGDIVSFRRESDGGITVYPGLTKERESFRYIIDADLCDSPNLLTRIITANYLTGHDTIQIVSKKELSSRHLEEVRGVSRRLTGLGIVEQNLKSVTLQSFVDPTKFPIYGLMRRLQIILSSMLEQAVKSVVEGRVALKITKGLLELSDKVRSLIEDSFNALMKGDLKKSNECIERVGACDALERSLTADVMRSVKEVNLAVGLRAIIWDVGQMARDAESIAEVAINRNLETASNFCQWEKAQ